jgi:minor tail protein
MADNNTSVNLVISASGAQAISEFNRFRAQVQTTRLELGALGGVAASIAPAIAALVGTLSVGAFAGMVKEVADVADDLVKLSQKTGISTEELSKLRYAATLSDVSNEQLSTGLAKLARSMESAAGGSGESAAAFRALGVSVVDAQGNLRGTDEVLMDIATAFAQSEDGAAKAAVAQQIFGRSGAELIPLLNSGAAGLKAMGDEAERFGVVISGETAKAAETFNDNLTRIAAQFDGVKVAAGNELIPVLAAISEAFVQNGTATDSFTAALGAVKVLLQTVVILGANVAYVFRQTGIEIGGILAQLNALAHGDFKGFQEIGRMMREDAAAARKALRDKGTPQDVLDNRAAREAQTLIDDARFNAISAQNANIDGRAKQAQDYAQKAADLIRQASEAAKSIKADDGERLAQRLCRRRAGESSRRRSGPPTHLRRRRPDRPPIHAPQPARLRHRRLGAGPHPGACPPGIAAHKPPRPQPGPLSRFRGAGHHQGSRARIQARCPGPRAPLIAPTLQAHPLSPSPLEFPPWPKSSTVSSKPKP